MLDLDDGDGYEKKQKNLQHSTVERWILKLIVLKF